jgi:broad specificity phosphatase PhoE
MLVYFITHPDVVVDPAVPVPRWRLSPRGLERMARIVRQSWVQYLGRIYCSEEQKAIDAAEVLARLCRAPILRLAGLGENDRSATGYLPKSEFEAMADEFFRQPGVSVQGWETAIAAQSRIVGTARQAVADAGRSASIAIVSHGAVGGLLMCHLKRVPISRDEDQPAGSGGNYFRFEMPAERLLQNWLPIDPPTTGGQS